MGRSGMQIHYLVPVLMQLRRCEQLGRGRAAAKRCSPHHAGEEWARETPSFSCQVGAPSTNCKITEPWNGLGCKLPQRSSSSILLPWSGCPQQLRLPRNPTSLASDTSRDGVGIRSFSKQPAFHLKFNIHTFQLGTLLSVQLTFLGGSTDWIMRVSSIKQHKKVIEISKVTFRPPLM